MAHHHGHHHHHHHNHHHGHHHHHDDHGNQFVTIFPFFYSRPRRPRTQVAFLDASIINPDETLVATSITLEDDRLDRNRNQSICLSILMLSGILGIILWLILGGTSIVCLSVFTFSSHNWTSVDFVNLGVNSDGAQFESSGMMTPQWKKMVLVSIIFGVIHFTSCLFYWTIKLKCVQPESRLIRFKSHATLVYLVSFLGCWIMSLWLLLAMESSFENWTTQVHATAVALIVLLILEWIGIIIFGLIELGDCYREAEVVTAYSTI